MASRDRLTHINERIDDLMSTKTSLKLFCWVVGLVLGALVLVSSFLWNGTKAAEASNKAIQSEVRDKMTEMSIDLQCIKRELENK
jgi:hypothetical protein